MDFRLNDLIDELMLRYIQSFSLTLDTRDYIPEIFLERYGKKLWRSFKKQFRATNKEYKRLRKASNA